MFVTGNSGFPKSLDVSKAIDKAAGALTAQASGFNTAGGKENFCKQDKSFRSDYGYKYSPLTPVSSEWHGYGTALKPAYEPVILARKPLDGTVAANVQKWGCGALWIDGGRVEAAGEEITNHARGAESAKSKGKYGDSKAQDTHQTTGQALGRWPANLLHDGSEEVVAGLGDAARFFYCAKASQAERNAGCEKNGHPCCKPLALCEYLAKLILPAVPGKLLVPFSGSGSEMIGAARAGWANVTGVEKEAEYAAIAQARLDHHAPEIMKSTNPELYEALYG